MSNIYQVRISKSDALFDAEESETLLEASLRQGVNLPHSCQNGACGQCAVLVLSGDVKDEGLSPRIGEEILTCQAYARSNLELLVDIVPELQAITVKTLPAKVDAIERVADDVIVLTLRFSPREEFHFLPGQYIDILFNGVRRSYSIANANSELKRIELHIRAVPNGLFTGHVFNGLKLNELLRFEGPLGSFFVRQGQRPIIFLAGGTGFAPAKAMVEKLLEKGDHRTLYFYWGVADAEDLYSNAPSEWQAANPKVHYIPVLSNPVDGRDWSGRCGFVHRAVLEDFDSLSDYEVYACGSPAMINAAKKDFVAAGLDSNAFYADAFVPNS